MTRDANLYILSHKDWMPLADTVKNHQDYTLKNDVTIFRLTIPRDQVQEYAILSLSEKADKIIQDYGASSASDKDLLRNSLHNYYGELLFGDKTNLAFLNKLL
jgi:hypothetical protein